jgi:hypothetical protein
VLGYGAAPRFPAPPPQLAALSGRPPPPAAATREPRDARSAFWGSDVCAGNVELANAFGGVRHARLLETHIRFPANERTALLASTRAPAPVSRWSDVCTRRASARRATVVVEPEHHKAAERRAARVPVERLEHIRETGSSARGTP